MLSAYDELFENNKRQIEILERVRTLIYKKWFGEFYRDNVPLPEGWRFEKLENLVTIKRGEVAAGEEISLVEAKNKITYPFFTSSKDSPKIIDRYSYDQTAILLTTARYFVVNIYRGKFEASDGCLILSLSLSLSQFLRERFSYIFDIRNNQKFSSSFGGESYRN
ncbi:putative type I restriction-modification system specificity subunit [Mycoplasma suis str. Illinois]|uniref:Putative type I restriction-modification system specificity subunit n=1 Tax=Mycoplasma suis (strain Illinois) TaxID=768700 RepID=F0QR09_MYCSL|nr:putative type I restriction-modification system specificity subunit [Mycoplasma suis str. Illinois]